ncbi:glycosyltransferase family 2 protein [Ruegeria sp. HKCCA4707]|uniref:glycosyltransferase family 2 protein n=1 Tax=Ruegeria sp. HKCCA4707 TaxID=2682984 RepID=UPI0014880A47
MPFQKFRIENLEKPFFPRHVVACANFEPTALAQSRRAPRLKTRFGFVGSAEGFDLLRFEAPTLALNPNTAPAVLASGLIDALVVESALDDLGGEWKLSFFDWSSAGQQARDLMRLAANAGVPRIALMRGNRGQVPLFAPLAIEADHVFVSDPAVQDALRCQGIAAELISAAFQPALYHGFVAGPEHAPSAFRLLSLDLARVVTDSRIEELLDSLAPFGLSLCSADHVVKKFRVDLLPSTLVDVCLGTVSADQLRHLFAASDLLVQIAWPDRDPGPDVQHALHAAASRCAVVILGEIAEDDPRRGFAQIVHNPRELRAFISRFKMDPVCAQMSIQSTWRKVHRNHSAGSFALQLARCVDTEATEPLGPRATVVSPTYRPGQIEKVLQMFRAQTWSNKELIVVANTDDPGQWDSAALCPEDCEQIVFLPRRFSPSTALNLGAARGGGDYVIRMDDDDNYGPNYVEDLMLGAAALWPDVMGKRAAFFHYVDDGRLLMIPPVNRPEFYQSSRIFSGGGHLAGFSHVVQRSLLKRLGYPEGVLAAADTSFLAAIEDEGNLLCLRADALNAVVERRGDSSSHTWHDAPDSNDEIFQELNLTLEGLLGQIEPGT